MNKVIIRRTSESHAFLDEGGLHPVLQTVYSNRAVYSLDELEHSLDRLLPMDHLKGLEEAVTVLAAAIEQQKRIIIVGDFDADGATSSALAVRALRMLGAEQVHYLVPNRFEYGYGLTPEIVEEARKWHPDIIVTVDNGISSIEGVRVAHECGIQVVVTDHHLPGDVLPQADAIVNPNQPGDLFSSKNLAGVGVIFYVMLALRSHLRDTRWFAMQNIEEPKLARLLDLVALGTVADVVPLDHNNRILVEQGIRRIRSGHACAGIIALLQIAGRSAERLVASDLGFAVAPRLNAAGRLEDMSIGIECLLTDDPAQALTLAQQLDALNKDRREIETGMREQAMDEIERLQLKPDNDSLPFGITLYDEVWHQGVIGILAARIKERLHRPVIAFAPGGEGELKGSARSIPGFHIRDALDAVAARYPGLITRFGGHAMAAGLSLPVENYPQFREAFDEEARRKLKQEDLRGVIHSDGELDPDYLGLDLAMMLRDAGPWGQGFPEPVFDGSFEVLQQRIVGERHLKMVVRPVAGKVHLDAIAFNALEQPWPRDAKQVRLAYRLDVNEFRGTRNAQLMVEHMEEMESSPGG